MKIKLIKVRSVVRKRWLFLMKTFLLLFCTAVFGFTTENSFSQQKVKIDVDKLVSVDEVFSIIQSQTKLSFIYPNDLFVNAPKVQLKKGVIEVSKLLEQAFSESNVKYELSGQNNIVIKPISIKSNPKTTQVQQKNKISGIVLDQNNKPLPGANILEKGTRNAIQTDFDGKFSLEVESQKSILVVSFIGFVAKEIPLNGQTNIKVVLQEERSDLHEVVVVGYGTQKKEAVTGAVAKADLKTYEKVPVTNIMERLKGSVAGLNVGDVNKAGNAPVFSIRGLATFGNGTPLIVLDGAIFNGSIADLAPSDIESVTVLKDASAAAVYGSRSGNGVILIETKKGKSINGKPTFNFTNSFAFINELNHLSVYDAPGYMQRLNDIMNDTRPVGSPAIPLDKTPDYLQTIERENYYATPDHKPTLEDPYSMFRQQGSNLMNSLSVSQRTDKMSYFLSGSMVDQKGVIIYDRFKQYTVRLNLESKVASWLTIGAKTFYSYRSYPDGRAYGNVGNLGSSTYFVSPYASMYNPDGSHNMFPQTITSFGNPFLMIPTAAYNRNNNLNGNFYANVKIPWIKGLSYNPSLTLMNMTAENGSFSNKGTFAGISVKGTGTNSYSRATTSLLDHLIKYNRTFAEKHNVDLTLLYSEQKNKNFEESQSANGFDNDVLGYNNLDAGAVQSIGTSASESAQVGQMARLTYSYDRRYALTGTVRKDGFSANAVGHKYDVFGSAGVNWTISNESFMKNVSWINSLALRGSYGSNGNQTISPYQTLSKIGNGYYYYQGDTGYTFTQAVSGLGNSTLLWESIVGFNGGIDFSVLNNRISGSIDVYSNKTQNLAFPQNLPPSLGFSSITSNAGEIGNQGFEINLQTVNIENDKFSWTSNVSFSLNRNKINRLLGDLNGDGVEDDLISSGQFIGKPLGSIYNYKVIGMWQQADKDNGTIMAGYQPGTYKLLDVDGDGKTTSDKDRVFLGTTDPNFRWSLANTFTYDKLSLLVYVNSVWGGNGYFLAPNAPQQDIYTGAGSINHPVYDYWTPSNPNAEFPRPTHAANEVVNMAKYYDRSYIQLQKIALNYDLTDHAKKLGISGLNLALSGENLYTYAPHWIGLDAATANGLTQSAIPSLRTIAINLNVNF